MIRKSDRGSRFEKFIKAELLGSHCTPHKSFRKLSGGHFGTRIFVLAQCLRCRKTKFWVKISGDHVSPVDFQILIKYRQCDRKLSENHSDARVFVPTPNLRCLRTVITPTFVTQIYWFESSVICHLIRRVGIACNYDLSVYPSHAILLLLRLLTGLL